MEQFRIHSKSWMDTDFPVLEQAARGIVPCPNGDTLESDTQRLRNSVRQLWSWVSKSRSALKRINRAAQEEYEIGGEV